MIRMNSIGGKIVPIRLLQALNSYFKVEAAGSTPGRECLAGVTTYLALAYIFFVQPAVLSAAGMDFGAVLSATCISSAVATLLMGILANYPIALAPAMGHNFFFAYTVVLAQGIPWQVALAAVFISGTVFILTSSIGLRERLIEAIPESLQHAIAVGIGLLIALVGLEWSGLVVAAPGTLVALGSLKSGTVLLSLFGLIVTGALFALKARGALLWGILLTAVAGRLAGIIQYEGLISRPASLQPTFLKLDIPGVLRPGMVSIILVFFLLMLFDTVGTLVGVAHQAGFIKDGKLPRARRALLADAIGTVQGAILGTSTVTCYVESAAGVAAGGRTGMANLVTAGLMLLSLFFQPLVRMVGGGIQGQGGIRLYPVIAPALILVGSLIVRSVRSIDWDEPTTSIPAFLTMMVMPLAFSITEGISFGVLSFVLLKLISGKRREVPILLYVFAGLFLLRYWIE